MAVIADPAFATEVEQMPIADMEQSVEMQPGDLDEKPTDALSENQGEPRSRQ